MAHEDYILIATNLCEGRRLADPTRLPGFDHAVNCVASALAETNPKFDRGRFLVAVNANKGEQE